MSWHFSQALEAAFWADTCSDGEPSVPWSETPTARDDSCSDRMKGTLHRSPFGTMYVPSTDARGLALLTLFREASRAKTSALPAEATDSTESAAASGWKWPGSFAKWDRASCTWRTRQCSLIEDSTEFSGTWPRWGVLRDGECSELTTLAPPSTESESGYWQTPTTRDGKGQSGLGNRIKRGKPGKPHVANLCDQIVDIGRPDLVRCIEFRYRLMAWPIGWTGCEPLATDKFQQWLRAHGFCWSDMNTHNGRGEARPTTEGTT